MLSPNSFEWLLINNSEFTGKSPKQNRTISELQKYINPTGYWTCLSRYGSYVASYPQPLQCANNLYVYRNVGNRTQARQLGARNSGWNILISKLQGKRTAKQTSSNRLTTSEILIMKMEYTFEADTSWFWMTVSHEEILGKLNRCETKWSEPFMILKQQITMSKMHFQSAIKMACFPSSTISLKCLDNAMYTICNGAIMNNKAERLHETGERFWWQLLLHNPYAYFRNQELYANKLKYKMCVSYGSIKRYSKVLLSGLANTDGRGLKRIKVSESLTNK
jgi:hypothetical protein